jgi:PAS domain S-box-containing protein
MNWVFEQTANVFESLFERSADAIWLFDQEAGVFVDCNAAAVDLMRAGTKEKLLGARPEDLSPPLQSDGISSREKTAQVIAMVEQRGSHRFEWTGKRFDGYEVPLEVLSTQINVSGRSLTVVVSRDVTERKQTEAALRESEQKFRELFEASSDAIQILDPKEGRIIDCNAATLRMAGGKDKAWFLSQSMQRFSPECQPDGRISSEAAREWVERALSDGPQRFEWLARRANGEELPVEVLITPVHLGGRTLLVNVSRDISDRKKSERQLLELNQSLERRVAERTSALATSEAQFRALVEHAPEAIVVFDGDTGRFIFGNKNA